MPFDPRAPNALCDPLIRFPSVDTVRAFRATDRDVWRGYGLNHQLRDQVSDAAGRAGIEPIAKEGQRAVGSGQREG